MKKEGKTVRRTSIGGQAVIEGVMMKGYRSIATAVRTPAGDITVESKYTKSVKERNIFFRLPFVRGVVNLLTQLVQGMGIIMRSAEVYGDFEEPTKTEKKVADKLNVNPMNVLMAASVALGVLLAVALFVFLPNFLTGLICDNTAIAQSDLYSLYYSLIEGGLLIVTFVAYILLVTLMKDVKRVFMYHGAEHKVIACYEHGLDLTVENARKMKREHSRCGTTFLFFVVAVSIVVFVFINFMLQKLGLLVPADFTAAKVINALIKIAFKLLFLPVVAGVSYELLKLLAKSDALIVRILRAPGMALQLLTTKEPTDDMLEVSITAFKTVQAMDADPTIPERRFEISSVPYAAARKRLEDIAKDADKADIDWIIVEATGKKRSELASLASLSKSEYEIAESIAKKMANGMPLQYALGYSEFEGLRLSVTPSVLIPRPETEELELEVEKAIRDIFANIARPDGEKPRVLDLCTGSGAIAIALAKRCGARVVGADISADAIEIAKANAIANGVEVEFRTGDMWEPVEEETFDVIACNPPYIPTAELKELEARVRDFEPSVALDGGKDGLKFYRIIEDGLEEHLAEGGCLILEFGIGQAQKVRDIFARFSVRTVKDMEGVDRIAIITR